MHRKLIVLAFVGFLPMAFLVHAQESAKQADTITVAPGDWPWWRGPARNGIAPPGQTPPSKWSATDNVRWKTPVPGRGHGSPIVVGNDVILATADMERQVQTVLCFHRHTGKLRWESIVHKGGFETKGNKKSSLASATPACDGRRVFINFLNDGAIYTTALARDGTKLWQTKVSDFVIHQGFGSSPALYQSLVIVTTDHKGGGVLAGLERATGKIVWKQHRPALPNYVSPIILPIAGRDQILLTGCDVVAGFDPFTGDKLWETPGSTTECVTSTVTDGQLMFTTGGYPKSHMSAVRTDGSGKVVWENRTRVYVPSLLARAGYLYGVLDNGVAVCWKCATGKEIWRAPLGGTFSASPVLVGDNIYATNESGQTFIYKASPEGFELLAENQLGKDVLSTPAICGSHIYMRVTVSTNGRRQEMLYCLGARD